MKKVLLLYATYGTGHRAVANYIESYLKEKEEDIEILNIDLLDYASPIVGKLSKKISENLMTKHSRIWSFIYRMTNGGCRSSVSMNASMKMLKNKNLRKLILDFQPDLCIATHFFGTSLIAQYKRKYSLQTKLITIVTDYEAHEMWLRNYAANDYLIVSSKEEKSRLIRKGIPEDILLVNGIPICVEEVPEVSRNALLEGYKLNPENLTCLFFSGGGNGSKVAIRYLKKMLKDKVSCNIIFISGKNEEVQKKATYYKEYYRAKNIVVLGFVNNVPELMQVCDFVITKPGGLQITESLYAKKPVMLINGNGGQENANDKYFVKSGYGRRFHFAPALSFYMERLANNPHLLDSYVEAMEHADSKAMEKLYRLIVKTLEKK